MTIRVGILTVSDTAARGDREDTSGQAIESWCAIHGYSVDRRDTVPDETSLIVSRLLQWCDSGEVDVVITTGGTGFGPRDVTPEATLAVLQRLAPGVAEAFRDAGRGQTPYAMLSRGVAGSRGKVFVANLPGSTGGVKDGLSVMEPLLEHVVALLQGGDPSHAAGAAGGGEP